jgi:predicted membrane channel-forming protein YqfA (hemolysin III family)
MHWTPCDYCSGIVMIVATATTFRYYLVVQYPVIGSGTSELLLYEETLEG